MSDDARNVSGQPAVTIEQLIALNDEIVALTKAGMPLERGLVGLGSDLPGRLRQIATTLGERMSRGESLSEALAALGDGVPKVYRAVVAAGVRSGRLPVALEGLSMFARGYSEARRSIGLALWYPVIVVSLAYVLFLFIATTLVPRFLDAFRSLGLPLHASMNVLEVVGRYAWFWGPIFPALLVLLVVAWHASSGSRVLGRGWGTGFLRWFPWMGSMMNGYEAASFADLLALLVEHGVPYPEALVLAGDASGDPTMARAAGELSSAIGRGASPSEALRGRGGFPPLLNWLLATGQSQGDLVAALKQMAKRYRGMARHQADKLRLFLPTILLFGIGASATLLYALALFVPLTSIWNGLATQNP